VQPPASLQALADPIYEAFYGLKEQPFAISTDPKFLFLSESHRRAYEELLAGLRRREGLMLLSGETGTGKTTLCRAVVKALGERTFSALILNPYMSGAEVLRVILRDFGFVSREEIRRGALAQADVPQLLDALDGFLRSLLPLETHAVVIIDEAQSLSPQVLDQVRLLSAFEQDGQRLMQVLLVGQPVLLGTLKSEPLYALNERLTRRVALAPLPAGEVDAYIRHRLEIAGGADSVSFSPEATALVAELSRGLPRRVNVLCDRALQEGRVEGANLITPELVKRAARSLIGAPEPPSEPTLVEAVDAREPATVPLDAPQAVPEAAPLLSFGQAETRPPTGSWRWMAAGAGALLLGGLGYTYYAHATLTGGFDVPALPAGPALNIAQPAPWSPVAIPSDEAVQQWLAATASPGGDSGQLPDDRHQLD
jgi:general secretion pathway protein A